MGIEKLTLELGVNEVRISWLMLALMIFQGIEEIIWNIISENESCRCGVENWILAVRWAKGLSDDDVDGADDVVEVFVDADVVELLVEWGNFFIFS